MLLRMAFMAFNAQQITAALKANRKQGEERSAIGEYLSLLQMQNRE